jgi:hypothetical protein
VTVPPLGALLARSAGSVLHSQVGSGKDGAFALRAMEIVVRLQCSFRPGPAAAGCGCDVGGDGGFELSVARSAGSVLHSQVGSGEEGLSRCARGSLLFASNARSGPIPLLLGVGGGNEMLCVEGGDGDAAGPVFAGARRCSAGEPFFLCQP